jgi:hypothetical protein
MKDDQPKHGLLLRRLLWFVWWLVRVDPEILSGCPTIDRFHFISKGLLLGAVAGIALFAWGGFFGAFWPIYVALPLTLVVIVWIVLIDQIMGASRWALQGVLATPGPARAFGLSTALILRLVIGFVTASATSYSATMLICHATIAAQQQRDRDAENAAKRAAGAAEKAQARRSILGALDAEVKAAQSEIDGINAQIDAVRRRRDTASQQVTDSQLSANCQLQGGPGCRKGKGLQYGAALIRQGKAANDMRQAEGEIPGLEGRRAVAEHRRDDALAAFRAREGEFLEAAKAIDKRVADEAVPARNDPVMSYMALEKVFASPEGPGARFYANLMLALLLVVELSYVVVSEYFGHATVYMARLIARTKILAAEAADQYRRSTGALFGQEGARELTSFRVLPRFAQSAGSN